MNHLHKFTVTSTLQAPHVKPVSPAQPALDVTKMSAAHRPAPVGVASLTDSTRGAGYQGSLEKAGIVVEPPSLAHDLPANVELLSCLKAELEKRLTHLVRQAIACVKRWMKRRHTHPATLQVRSNAELKDALEEEPEDDDYKLAIKENNVRPLPCTGAERSWYLTDD